MTPSEVITEVRRLIQDTRPPYRYSDAVLLGFVNQTLKRMVMLRPDLFAVIGEIPTTAGTVLQTCPADSMRLIEVFQVKDGDAVTEVNRETLDRTLPNWQREAAGSPVNFMRHVRNPNRFFVYPRPTAGISLIAEYAQTPPDYALDDEITYPIDTYFPTVVDGVVFLAESIDNEHVNSNRAKLFQDSFTQSLGVAMQSRTLTDTESGGLDPEAGDLMADRTFASLVPRVQASAPGCPNPTILQYIRDAAIRACERTLAWRYQAPLFNLLPGVHEYVYEKPINAEVHAVLAAVVNNSPLEQLTLDKAIELYPHWVDLYSGEAPSVVWSQTPSNAFNTFDYNEALFNENSPYVLPPAIVADGSTPRSITQISPDKYIVLPLPDAARTYQMRMFMALKPKRDATAMDEVPFNELEEVIMHGALQHLLVLPNQAWSDRELAAYHAKQFVYQIAERRARANIGTNRGMVRARMQSFGA